MKYLRSTIGWRCTLQKNPMNLAPHRPLLAGVLMLDGIGFCTLDRWRIVNALLLLLLLLIAWIKGCVQPWTEVWENIDGQGKITLLEIWNTDYSDSWPGIPAIIVTK